MSGAVMGGAARENAALLSFDRVSFDYDGHVALDDVSFGVRRGEAVALVGPNGCGKSTALRLATGLSHPSSGVVAFDGDRIDAQAMSDRRFAKRYHQRVGLVFQNPDVQLFCPTVAEEVAFGPRQMGLSPEEASRRTDETIELFGLEELADRAPFQLSGGERKRVALACVVSMAPELLLLDEPTASLDEDAESEVIEFLRAYVAAGHSVLATTHDRTLVSALSAREVRIDKHHRVMDSLP